MSRLIEPPQHISLLLTSEDHYNALAATTLAGNSDTLVLLGSGES